jgi:hypothetical protein
MPSAKNVSQLQAVQEKVKKAKSVVFTNYTITVAQQRTSRRAKVSWRWFMVKNTNEPCIGKVFKRYAQGQTDVVLS